MDRSRPVQVGAEQTWASADTSSTISAGITTGGTLWLWGGEHSPQHSYDDDRRGSLVPLQIGTDTDWASVATSHDHVLALKKDGSLWTWGGNWAGQLGIGTRSGFPLGTPWSGCTLAIRSDGTLWVWLPDHPMTRVGTSGDWVAVAGGGRAVGLRSTIAAP